MRVQTDVLGSASGAGAVNFVVRAGPLVGYGHLMRSLQVAGQIADRVSVRFSVLEGDGGEQAASEWVPYPLRLDMTEEALHRELAGGLSVLDFRPAGDRELLIGRLKAVGCEWIGFQDRGLGMSGSVATIDGSPVASEGNDRDTDGSLRRYTGLDYAVISASCTQHRRRSLDREIPGSARTLVVTFGGGKPDRFLHRVGPALAKVAETLEITLLAGIDSGGERYFGTSSQVNVHRSVSDLPAYLASADLALVAGGITLLECACVGTPAIAVSLDDAQLRNAEAMDDQGACVSAGLAHELSAGELERKVFALANDAERRKEMTSRGLSLVDGHGAARVASVLRSILVETGTAVSP